MADETDTIADGTPLPVDGVPEPPYISLPGGDALVIDDARAITRASAARVVVIAGAAESGKTNILSSLYELFNAGSVAGCRFAGSKTLLGFERRCHASRIASNRSHPETERTPFGPTQFLHLRVELPEGQRHLDLLLTDVSGEAFRLAKDYDDECRKLVVLHRADHFAVVLDGARASNLVSRASAVSEVRQLLRTCLECRMIGYDTEVQLIVSKADLWMRNPSGGVRTFIDEAVVALEQTYGDEVGKFSVVHLAARPEPPDESFPFGHKLDGLLNLWLTGTSLYTGGSDHTPPSKGMRREFDRLLYRQND
jgi:hypothetical protein